MCRPDSLCMLKYNDLGRRRVTDGKRLTLYRVKYIVCLERSDLRAKNRPPLPRNPSRCHRSNDIWHSNSPIPSTAKAETSAASFDVINPAAGEHRSRNAPTPRANSSTARSRRRAARFRPGPQRASPSAARAIAAFAHALAKRIDEIGPVLTREQGKPVGQAKWEIGGAVHELEAMCTEELTSELDPQRRQAPRRDRLSPDRRRGRHHALEFPDHPGRAQDRARPLCRQHDGVEAVALYAAGDAAHGRGGARRRCRAACSTSSRGGNELGQWMTEHPGIDRISFTGSVPTGKKVMASAAAR